MPGPTPPCPQIRASGKGPRAPPAVLTDFAQRPRRSAAAGPEGSASAPGGRGDRGPALTEVQELLDRERRWREARVALNLLGHRLLQQPPEQPHPHPDSAETGRDAQAAARTGAAEPRGLGTLAKRVARPPPRRRWCSRRSTSSTSSTSSLAAAGRPRLSQAPPTGAEPAAARTRGARPHALAADWPLLPSVSLARAQPGAGASLLASWDPNKPGKCSWDPGPVRG